MPNVSNNELTTKYLVLLRIYEMKATVKRVTNVIKADGPKNRPVPRAMLRINDRIAVK
jgi:hypothetical protein